MRYKLFSPLSEEDFREMADKDEVDEMVFYTTLYELEYALGEGHVYFEVYYNDYEFNGQFEGIGEN